MSTALSWQEERQLVKELQDTLCVQQSYRGREVLWEELSGISPALAEYEAKTLRHYVSLMGAAGFFTDYEETDRACCFREYLPSVYGWQGKLVPQLSLREEFRAYRWCLVFAVVLWAVGIFLL